MATLPEIYRGAVGEEPDDDGGSALRDFLRQSVVYEKAGGLVPQALVSFGFWGSVALVGAGLLALLVPGADSIRSGGFFLLLKSAAAGLEGFMRQISLPAIGLGLLLVGVDGYLIIRATGLWSRYVIVLQTILGSVGGLLAVAFLGMVLLNLMIWLLIIAAIVMACLALLGLIGGG